MKKIFFLTSILSIFTLSCSQEAIEDVQGTVFPEDSYTWIDPTFGEIHISTPANNSLRKEITFQTEGESDCHVEFWKEADKTDMRKSHSSTGAGDHKITLIFMEGNTGYKWQIKDSEGHASRIMGFKSGPVPDQMLDYITEGKPTGEYTFDGFILYADKEKDYLLMIDDKAGIVWYERFSPVKCSSFSYDPDTKTISFMHGTTDIKPCGSQLTCIDFYGNKLLDIPRENLKNHLMHHDIYRMKDGNWIYTHFVQREFDFTPLGVNKRMTVQGDGLTIMNAKGKTLWEWNCFDHLDPLKDPNILVTEPKPVKDDWMHTNSIIEDEDGNIYISCNKMKQMMKINRTTGDVMWRLGYNGNVKIEGEKENELSPDRLHSLEFGKDGEIHLFENGDRDREYSRILSYKVNDIEKTAVCLNAMMLPLDLRSHYNSNAYEVDDEHYIVHTTAKFKTVIIEKTGDIVWSKPIKGLSFRAIYISEPEL